MPAGRVVARSEHYHALALPHGPGLRKMWQLEQVSACGWWSLCCLWHVVQSARVFLGLDSWGEWQLLQDAARCA